MAFQSYGGYVWSNNEAPEYNPTSSQGLQLAVAAGIGAGAFGMATRTMASGNRPIDYVVAGSRMAGNYSPLQLLNTFRVPEMLSGFTSAKFQGLEGGSFSWEKAFFQSESSQQWLAYATGQDQSVFQQADELIFRRGDDTARGSLFAKIGGEEKLLSKNIMLQSMGDEHISHIIDETGLNRFTQGLFAAGDMYQRESFKADDVFVANVLDDAGDRIKKQTPWLPAPSIGGDIHGVKDALRRTSWARGVLAFEAGRFNQLISGVTEQFLGDTGAKFVNKVIGISPGVIEGPASSMFMRYGMRAGAVGAGILGVQQLDWMRRQFSLPGQALASAAVSSGVAFATSKMKLHPNAALMAGVASFAGQMLLPGFDQGVMQGIATMGTKAATFRANDMNPFNYVRRGLESFFPGSSSLEFGALMGVGAIMSTTLRVPTSGQRLSMTLLEKLTSSGSQLPMKLGLPNNLSNIQNNLSVSDIQKYNQNTRDIFWSRAGEEAFGIGSFPSQSFDDRRAITKMMKSKYQGDSLGYMKKMNQLWSMAETDYRDLSRSNEMTTALLGKLEDIAGKHQGGTLWDFMARETKGFATQTVYSYFGADAAAHKTTREAIRAMGYKGLTGRLGRLGTVGVAAVGLQQLLTGGLLGSMETADELSDAYSGKKLVDVKSSRYWEAGGTPFGGNLPEYARPHQYHLMMNRVRERGIWGENEDEISPIGKFFKKNFTYDLERQNYYDRPYPITSAAFADIPIIGGILSSTVGRLIKPARLMHVNEWIRQGAAGPEFASVFQGSRREPAYALGAPGPGVPKSPYSTAYQASFLSYQFRELEGMTGWLKNTFQQTLTGDDIFGADQPVLSDASLMTSPRTRFWEAQLGGSLFTNEFLRRILPRYRSEIQRQNPVMNSMPSWLPEKFHYGDPYRSVEWGEARLPGSGYAALHPELQGVDPEGYPLIYKYAILSDVAPFSVEYKRTKQAVYQKRMEGAYSQREIEYMDNIDIMHARVTAGHVDNSDAGFIPRAVRKVAAPLEYMIPMGFRPTQKLMSQERGIIEQYEYERMYGTPMAFWDKPWRDWFRPSLYSAMNLMGYQGKPLHRLAADKNAEQFDKLEFVKWMRLAEGAEMRGDKAAASRYRWAAGSTRTGVNPQGSPMSIYWSLPESERPFFNAFAMADPDKRERIREMVPADQVHLYESLWQRLDAGDESLWAGSKTSVDDQHLANQAVSSANYLAGEPMPGQDWIGWHEDVDMADIRVRYVDRMGGELADYGLWEKQLKKSMQQPMLAGSADFMFQGSVPGAGHYMRRQMHDLNGTSTNLQVAMNGGLTPSASFVYNDTRDNDILSALGRYLGGY